MAKLIIHTDGGSRGNPGPAACAAVFLNPQKDVVFQTSKFLGVATNNEAEYQGVILAFEELLANPQLYTSYSEIEFTLDSELVVHQLNGRYKIKKAELQTLAQTIRQAQNQLSQKITYLHVRRHLNQLPDHLLNEELDRH